MSMRNWRKLAKQKAAVDRQTQAIHQKYRRHKINKEFSRLSGEEFFKPVTTRLKSAAAAEEENSDNAAENPDYTMDEFDRTNPFGEEFMPDAPTPPPSPEPEPSPTPEPAPPPPPPPPACPPPAYQLFEDNGDLPPSLQLMEEKSARKEWGAPGPVALKYPHESTLLGTVYQLITKHGNDTGYREKSKTSQLHGLSLEDLKKIRGGIYEKRRATQPLSKKIQDGKQRLKPMPPRKSEKIPPSGHEPKACCRAQAIN